jgi:hypothetical protein
LTKKNRFVLAALLGALLALAACRGGGQPAARQHGDGHASPPVLTVPQSAASRTPAADVPHFYENPEDAKPFPATLDPSQFTDPAVKQAYAVARRIPEVLAAQPCYCYCHASFGHGSLLHCHVDDHSAA